MISVSRDTLIVSLVGLLTLVSALACLLLMPADPGYSHIDASLWSADKPAHSPPPAASQSR